MTSAKSFLERLAAALNVAGAPWMITGSTASAFYGEPRATQDVDVVIDPTAGQLARLLSELEDGFYLLPRIGLTGAPE